MSAEGASRRRQTEGIGDRQACDRTVDVLGSRYKVRVLDGAMFAAGAAVMYEVDLDNAIASVPNIDGDVARVAVFAFAAGVSAAIHEMRRRRRRSK